MATRKCNPSIFRRIWWYKLWHPRCHSLFWQTALLHMKFQAMLRKGIYLHSSSHQALLVSGEKQQQLQFTPPSMRQGKMGWNHCRWILRMSV